MLKQNGSASDIALTLAELKAVHVSEDHPDILVIGADQTMECEGRLYDKPMDMAAARANLNDLGGRTHTLCSAVAVVRDGQVIWHHAAMAHLRMRPLDGEAINDYLAATGDSVLTSVGCYRLEDAGARLFEYIDGDYFTILGLPLLPLLAFLREIGAVD